MTFKGPIAILCILALGSAPGCTSLQLEPPSTRDSDWRTQGGSSARTHAVEADVSLPLHRTWRANVDAAIGAGGVIAAGAHLLVPTRRGDVIALDAESGSRVGRSRLGGPVIGSPVLVGNLLIAATAAGRNSIVAHDLQRDRQRWSRDVGPIEGSLLRHGDLIIAASTDGSVTALDLATGDERWRVTPDSAAGFIASPAAIDEARIVVVDDRGQASAIEIAGGSVAWSTTLGGPVHATPATSGETIVMATARGTVTALRSADGHTKWTYSADDSLVRLTAPAVAGEQVFVGGTDRLIRCLDLTSGLECWRTPLPRGLAAPPLVMGQTLFVVTLGGSLHAMDRTSGEMLWSERLPGPARSAPIPVGGGVVVSADRYVMLYQSP